MKQSYYLYKSGRLQRKDNTLEIVYKDNTKKSIPVERVDDIYVMTEFDFNTSLLNFLSQFGINIHFFNYYGFYTGTYYPKELLVSGKLLIKQVEHYNDKEKRLNIAKAFIEAASYNIYRNLTYYNNRGKDLKDYMKEIDFLRKQIKYKYKRDEQAKKLFEEVKDSEFIKNALVLNTPMPISLKEAYYEYHYGIFSDAYLKKQQNS